MRTARQFAAGKAVRLSKPLLMMYLFLATMVQPPTIFVYGEAKLQAVNLISKSSTLESMKALLRNNKELKPFLLCCIQTTTWIVERSCVWSNSTSGALHHLVTSSVGSRRLIAHGRNSLTKLPFNWTTPIQPLLFLNFKEFFATWKDWNGTMLGAVSI